MYHIFIVISILQKELSPFPLTHNKEETKSIASTTCNMQKTKPLQPTLWIVLILKMFMFAWGLAQFVCHLTKGRNKKNILEWMGLGFNFHHGFQSKRCYMRSGFYCLQVVRMFFYAKTRGNKWNQHLKHQKSHCWVVGWVHCMDTQCAITSDVDNG
jgi:hypothetical protein